MSKIYKMLPAIILIFLSSSIKVNAGDYSVIINNSSDFSGSESEKNSIVKRIFLKTQSSWPNGVKAKPIGLKPDTAEYKAFLSNVMEMSDSEITSHWLSAKQKTGTTPPTAVGRSKIAIKLIAKKKGAVGYINNADLEGLPETVKVLFGF